jgi:hypothetical protein
MAIQSVSDPIREPGPAAMNHDASVYLAWIQSMGEVLMNVRANDVIEGQAVANYGGLILALAEAAEELADKERAEMTQAKAA